MSGRISTGMRSNERPRPERGQLDGAREVRTQYSARAEIKPFFVSELLLASRLSHRFVTGPGPEPAPVVYRLSRLAWAARRGRLRFRADRRRRFMACVAPFRVAYSFLRGRQ